MATPSLSTRDGALSLPILQPRPRTGPPAPRRSRIALIRACVLLFVYAAITLHVLHWWITGRSAGRFVLSDSMRTLELGEINPGFLLFAASLVVTAIFGRFMCGWLCHMGALQDLCAWFLRRLGMRPRLFRSRFLAWVPAVIALYMFVWPTLRREVVSPLLGRAETPFPGWALDLSTERLWEGLPPWYVAVPFLFLCGFATVWFLGARGLCRYGCPYGGFLLPAEQLAVARVVVNPSLCDQCGLCTAACTAGVRVHDEVRRYGAVMDRNCVRSLDCVGACPSGALRLGFSRPALAARAPAHDRPARKYDLSLGEEALCATVFSAVFFVTRGLYDLVPMLVSVTLGALAAVIAWKAWRLWRDINVRMGFWQLRRRGRLTPHGRIYFAATAMLAALLLHSAAIRLVLLIAEGADQQVTVSLGDALAGRIPDADRIAAQSARDWYALARPFWRGGLALAPTPEAEFRLAWAHLAAGECPQAEAVLMRLCGDPRTRDQAAGELADLLLVRRDYQGAEAVLASAVQADVRCFGSRDALALLWCRTGRATLAEAMFRRLLAERPSDTSARIGLGRTLLLSGDRDAGLDELGRAVADQPRHPDARRELALALASLGRAGEAAVHLRAAAAAWPSRAAEMNRLERQITTASRSQR